MASGTAAARAEDAPHGHLRRKRKEAAGRAGQPAVAAAGEGMATGQPVAS